MEPPPVVARSTPEPNPIVIPGGSLVVLIGASGSGKTTFARRHFRPTEILSSDAFRAMLTDDEGDQRVSRQAFALLHHVALERLRRRRTTVIDATSVRSAARRALLALSATTRSRAIAIVFDLPLELCLARNASRVDRSVDSAVVTEQAVALGRALRSGRLHAEGFHAIHVLVGSNAAATAEVVRATEHADRP
jgi:protein phosphatase